MDIEALKAAVKSLERAVPTSDAHHADICLALGALVRIIYRRENSTDVAGYFVRNDDLQAVARRIDEILKDK